MFPIRALIEGGPQISASTAAQTTVNDSAAVIVSANHKRKGLLIVNTGTTIVYLAMGTGDPSATVYHVALAACAVANDGTGGSWSDDTWIGPVRAISSAAGGKIVITEFFTGSPNWNLAADRGTNEGT
jgi:hypothetical protein